MNNNAAEYALSIAQEIRENTRNGNPYGLNDNGEPVTAWEYLDNVLDMEYTTTPQHEYLGSRIAITLGGPNAWIDTRAGEIVVYWGSDTAREWLPGDFIDGLDEMLSENFVMDY